MHLSSEIIERKIKLEKAQGFEYIENVVDCLETYLCNREKYPNIESFFPILLDTVVDQLKSHNEKSKQVK